MPRIPSYPLIGSLSNDDLLVIDDVSQQYATKSVELQSLKGYFNTGQATTTYVDDKVVSGAAFDTNTGVLTLTRTDGVDVTRGLDGRYALTTDVFSGNYNDLTNKPTIPTDNSQLANGEGYTDNLGIVQSLTTNSSSGAATLVDGVLNIPQYSSGGGGGSGTVTSISTTAPITGGTITTSGTIGITQASASGSGYISSTDWNTFNNKQSTSEKGAASGYAPLDANEKVPAANLPDSIVGAVVYQGTWNADTDTPALPTPAAGNNGHYYIVSDPGTYLGTTYAVGDWAISNGIAWEKVDNTQDVNSVFGRQGNVVADAGDYSAFYDANVQSNWNDTDTNSDAFILNKPTTITTDQANAIAANSNKTSFPGFGTTQGTALEGNTIIPAAYTDADVDTHLNKTAQTQDNYVLSLSGNDYTWVAQSGGGGGIGGSGIDTQMAIFDSTSTITSTQAVAVNSSSQIIMDVLRSSTSYANDTAAQAGGVPYGGLYRTESTVKINLLGSSPGPGPGEVEIGSLIWTDANSTTLASSGGTIPIFTTNQEADDARSTRTPGAVYWDFDSANASRGLFYNRWAAAAITPPSGFRLPTRNDWNNLRAELIALDSLSNITAIGGGTNAFWNNSIQSNPDYNLSGFESLGAGYAEFSGIQLRFWDDSEMWWELEGASAPVGQAGTGFWANGPNTVITSNNFQLFWSFNCIRFCKDA
jgi:hypothetical protein